jgi:hypothetical protein
MKFKILPKVNRFTDSEGIRHKPGDIVDLPVSYLGVNWLEPLEKPNKVEVPPAKVEPVAPAPVEEKSVSPLGKSAKKSKS